MVKQEKDLANNIFFSNLEKKIIAAIITMYTAMHLHANASASLSRNFPYFMSVLCSALFSIAASAIASAAAIGVVGGVRLPESGS